MPAKNTDSFCEQDESVNLEVEAFEKVLLQDFDKFCNSQTNRDKRAVESG